ncbi:hypothetical protein CB0940_01352 [Cercospora beticola]|uniref:N-acetyltransferase domain-containing protein n=1 Tax=Cercospora beticola TaxID=122368 RepID=A0A2G5I6N0_CERBT|nr:hypothetical protein CB0940_01352 [Cercospora beticola]PIB00486.1 hypothetical protein CB0940_01352 [Cercospora beticola]WPA96788.1 hypothetical protein RHO25_001396 [Cercospora beticola]CAK1354845.1 unnamed protein product [Cercospora beticola]
MSQSSLLAWLNKPAIVRSAPSLEQSQTPDTGKLPVQITTPAADVEASQPQSDHSPTNELTAHLSERRPLPQNVELRSCTQADIPHLKRLTSLLLPIPYPDKFYKDIVNDPVTNSITLLAVWHDDSTSQSKGKGRLIGAIRCRLLEPSTASTEFPSREATAPVLYLSTLVLLSPYRHHGIATHLLRTVVQKAAEDYGVTRVGAHVWEANADGLAWYRKREFRETRREPGYYRRLDPSAAVVVERDVRVADFLST